MIKLYSPANEIELALIKSILTSEGIPYFVHNEHYGSMHVGPKIGLLNAKTILIDPAYEEQAKDTLAEFLQNDRGEQTGTTSGYTIFDKIRMIIESLFFGWFIPGRKLHKKAATENNNHENSG